VKLSEILFTRTVREVSGHESLCNKQFGFRPKHRTTLQLSRLVVSRNFGEKRETGAVFLYVPTAFDTL
jgi:hypothetical protein